MRTLSVILATVFTTATALTAVAQPAIWSGGGDAVSWHDPFNWTGGAVPGSANDVVITNGLGTNVAISSGNITIKSIHCTRNLTISGDH